MVELPPLVERARAVARHRLILAGVVLPDLRNSLLVGTRRG